MLGQDLLVLDTEAALRAGLEGFASTVRLALREAQLRPAALYMGGSGGVTDRGTTPGAGLAAAQPGSARWPGLPGR